MFFFRVVRAELRKHYAQEFVSYRTAFWFLILPFANGLLYYSMYLPFASGLVPVEIFDNRVGVDIVGFTLIGQLLFTFFVGVSVAGAVFDIERYQGTFETLLLTPASRVAVILGVLFAAVVQYLWLIVGVVSVFVFFFRVPIVINDPIALLLSLLLSYLSLVGLGLCLEAVFIHTRKGILLGTTLQEPVAFVSGVIVPSETLPSRVGRVAYLLPLTLGLICVRLTLLAGATLADVWALLVVLLLMTGLLPLVGKWLIAFAEAAAKRKGTLGMA